MTRISLRLMAPGVALAFAALVPAAGSARTLPRKAPVRKPVSRAVDPMTAALKTAVRLELAPAAATLDGPRAAQRLVVTAVLKDGATVDVTERVVYSVSAPRLMKVTAGIVRPVADGKARLVARLGTLAAPPAIITVANAKAPAEVEFVNDIMPILSKAGCNSTACHGSPVGKGGLKFSLFGYEPELDYPAIATDAEGKRINKTDPAQSLFLQKPAMTVPHAGGRRIVPGSPEHATVLAWLKSGAPGIGELEARVKSVSVTPEQPWMPAPGSTQRLVVTAEMSDGTARDVTDRALFTSNDDAVADVDADGKVTAKRPGETAVMIRYLGQVAVARVAVLPPWKIASYPRLPRANYVDDHVQAKLRKLRVVPSDPCTDEEFIRRAALDTCGLTPTPEEVRQFLADTDPQKRAKLVDRLLERPEFVDLWTLKWNDTLRNNPQVTRRGVLDYYKWIRDQVAKNRPYHEFVRDLLTATGRTVDGQITVAMLQPNMQQRPRIQQMLDQVNAQPFNGATNYFVVSRDPLDMTSATSQVFLGVRIECARCHNHPFEKWTQSDYYGLATFFSGMNARGRNQVATIIAANPRAPALKHPKTNEVVEPKTLDGVEVKLAGVTDRRTVLAEWITSPTNPFFAKAAVNRIWGHYFGRGIVEPVDDLRVTNPPANPDLLDALAKDLVQHGFDLKQIHRAIMNSRTYQQSSRPNRYNAQDTSNFARFYPKRMMAEQLYDSISQATGVFLQVGGGRRRRGGGGGRYGNPLGDEPIERVTQIPAMPNARRGPAGNLGQFLDTFGKPRREVACECERSTDGNMGQALALINGDEVNSKIASPRGRVQQLAGSQKPDPEVVEELYLSTLSRRPTAAETREASALIASGKSRGEGIEDLMWSLLNSREFLFNH